jgi:hypothetical protein
VPASNMSIGITSGMMGGASSNGMMGGTSSKSRRSSTEEAAVTRAGSSVDSGTTSSGGGSGGCGSNPSGDMGGNVGDVGMGHYSGRRSVVRKIPRRGGRGGFKAPRRANPAQPPQQQHQSLPPQQSSSSSGGEARASSQGAGGSTCAPLDTADAMMAAVCRGLWSIMKDSADGRLPMIHAGYLKLWQLSRPRLDVKYVRREVWLCV